MSINETARNHLTSTDASASAISAKVYRSDAAGDERAKMGHVVVTSGHMPEGLERCVDQLAPAAIPAQSSASLLRTLRPFAGAIEPFAGTASAMISSATL
jgi:hypothetical protein